MGSKNKSVLISLDHFPILGELYSAVCTMCQMFALKTRTDILGPTLDHEAGFLDIKGNNTYSTKFSGLCREKARVLLPRFDYAFSQGTVN